MHVPLSLACGAYDRTVALARGDIAPEGIDLTYLALPVEETFFRMTRTGSSTPPRCRCPPT